MELAIDFDLDDLNENDLNAIIDHLSVSANSTNVIGEFCEENIELIRENVFTKFKELKVTLAIVRAYREKTKQLRTKIKDYAERVEKLEDENNQLHHKINIKNDLLNEMLAFDECEQKRDSFSQSLSNTALRDANLNTITSSQITTLAYDNISVGSNDRFSIEKSTTYRLPPETSSSDVDPVFRRNSNHSMGPKNMKGLNKDDDGFNFYVEKMQELCLHSKTLTKDERNLIEQLLVNFTEYLNQNKSINEFLTSNIEDVIQQKEEINYLLAEIERLEGEKTELASTNETNTARVEFLTGKLNDVNEKLYNVTKKCEFYEDRYGVNKDLTGGITGNQDRYSIDDTPTRESNSCADSQRGKNSLNFSSALSTSVSKGGLNSSLDDDHDYSGTRKPMRKKPNATPKFKLVKSMEGSSMLNKWKNLATTSRGLQITKQLFKEDYTAESAINNADSEFPSMKSSSHTTVNQGNHSNEPSSPLTSSSRAADANSAARKGPKIIAAVTRMGQLHQANKKTTPQHKQETPESKNRGIMSRFGAVGDPFDLLKSPAVPAPIHQSTSGTIVDPNADNFENIPPSKESGADQLDKNQIEDLLKKLDSTVDVVINGENPRPPESLSKTSGHSSKDDSQKNNVYNSVKTFLSSYLKSPFK